MRAERRHKKETLKKRISSYFRMWLKKEPEKVGKYIDTPKQCSAYCCGNPRKHFHEVTIQEKKAELYQEDE